MQEFKDFIKSRRKINLVMVLINIGIFILLSQLGDSENAGFLFRYGAMYTPAVLEDGEWYRLITCMFLHFGVQHIFYNMLLLIFIGDTLEKEVGGFKYLLIYLGGGILGNVLSLLADIYIPQVSSYAVSAGASGGIFAVVGALIWITYRNRKSLDGYSAKRLILMAVLSVANGFTSSGVDNWAHAGGLAGGFLIALLVYRKKDDFRRSLSEYR